MKAEPLDQNDDLETWKDLEGLEGKYKVSSRGRIGHFYKNVRWVIVRPCRERTGYSIVRLWTDIGECKGVRVHRLVAKTFIPNPDNHKEVNHINGIKDDNRVENLEWCDRKYNAEYRNVLRPDMNRGENNPGSKHTNEQILEVYNLAWEGELTYKQIGEMYDLHPVQVAWVKFGKSWAHVTKHEANVRNGMELKQTRYAFGECRGETNFRSKLNSKQVLEIYNLAHNQKLTDKKISSMYNISPSNVSSIKRGLTWSHVTDHARDE